MHDIAVNTSVQVSMWRCSHPFWVYVVIPCLTFEDPPDSFPKRLPHFTFPLAVYEGSGFPILTNTVIIFLIPATLVGVTWNLTVALI